MLDTYYGKQLSADDLELRALTRIPPQTRSNEAMLFGTKWWDYRMMHPTSATYLFAHCYEIAIRDNYAKTKDVNEAVTLDVWKGERDIFKRAIDTMSFWRARQFCDRIGVRYDFALRYAMNRSADRGWTMFPRPNQLYEESLVLDVRDAWQSHTKNVFETAKHPDYLFSNDRGLEHQRAYRTWLVERCKTRQRPQAPLARCFREGQLDPAQVADLFDPKVIADAVKSAAL